VYLKKRGKKNTEKDIKKRTKEKHKGEKHYEYHSPIRIITQKASSNGQSTLA